MVCFKNLHISFKKRIVLRVVFDIVCILLVAAGIFAIKYGSKPYHRGFFCDDESLKHPYLQDTISVVVVGCVGTIVPLVMIVTSEFALRHHQNVCIVTPKSSLVRSRSWYMAAYSSIAVFVFGIAVTQFLTEIGKYSIGRLRPHFLTLCNPQWVSVNCNSGFIVDQVCTSTDSDKLTESRLSFPSGHASFSIYCMMYIILYLQGRMSCHSALFLKPLAQLVFFSIAFFTCLSRISDYKHHWSDVLAGAILGAFVCVSVVICLTDFGRAICNRNMGCAIKADKNEIQDTHTVVESSNSQFDVILASRDSLHRDMNNKPCIVQMNI